MNFSLTSAQRYMQLGKKTGGEFIAYKNSVNDVILTSLLFLSLLWSLNMTMLTGVIACYENYWTDDLHNHFMTYKNRRNFLVKIENINCHQQFYFMN